MILCFLWEVLRDGISNWLIKLEEGKRRKYIDEDVESIICAFKWGWNGSVSINTGIVAVWECYNLRMYLLCQIENRFKK
jgi:hypothetical protein